MNIAIISYYYKHKSAMASIRAEKLAKYMAALGEEVTVITSMQRDTWTKEYKTPEPSERINEIYASETRRWGCIRRYLDKRMTRGKERIHDSAATTPTARTKPTLFGKIKSHLRWLFYFRLNKTEDACLLSSLIDGHKRAGRPRFDVAVATYPSYGAVLFGIWLKRHGYAKRLVLDLRDPIVNPDVRHRGAEVRYDRRCQKNALRHADLAVCVSQGILDGIRGDATSHGVPFKVITNGYDGDDITDEAFEFDRRKFNFLYTGSTYHGRRSLDILAKALRELIDEGTLREDSLCFNYCGGEFDVLASQLKKYSLDGLAKNHGTVPRETSLAMQRGADALVLITWNSENGLGVIPGKLYEYISSGKPTVALVYGDKADSEVARIIESGGFGTVAEEASYSNESFKRALRSVISGEHKFCSDVEKYSYESLARDYVEFLLKN